MTSIEKYFWTKERLLYILYMYPYSIFNKWTAYKIYRKMYGNATFTYVNETMDILEKEGFIEKVETTKEDLRMNGYKVNKKPKRRLKRKQKKYVLTKKGEAFINVLIKEFKHVLNAEI